MPLDPDELLTIAEACAEFGWKIGDLQTYLIAGGFVLAKKADGYYKRPRGFWKSDLAQRELFHLYSNTNKVLRNSTELRLRSDHAYRVVCYAATEREWMASCPRPAQSLKRLLDKLLKVRSWHKFSDVILGVRKKSDLPEDELDIPENELDIPEDELGIPGRLKEILVLELRPELNHPWNAQHKIINPLHVTPEQLISAIKRALQKPKVPNGRGRLEKLRELYEVLQDDFYWLTGESPKCYVSREVYKSPIERFFDKVHEIGELGTKSDLFGELGPYSSEPPPLLSLQNLKPRKCEI